MYAKRLQDMTAGVDIDFNAVDDEASEAELEQEGEEIA